MINARVSISAKVYIVPPIGIKATDQKCTEYNNPSLYYVYDNV